MTFPRCYPRNELEISYSNLWWAISTSIYVVALIQNQYSISTSSMAFMSILTSLICVLLCYNSLAVSDGQSNLKTYIVHVELPDTQLSSSSSIENRESLESWYSSFLPIPVTTSSNEAPPSLIYPYHNIFKGFAAKLSPDQVKEMEKIPGFISAKPQQVLHLHTTHSQSFLGLQQNVGFWKESNYGKGVIIGVLDTGINPDHPSFGDKGMPPPPAKWKGKCQFNSTMCNNKLIGARFFESGNGSPMDENGHGTHTAGTAAGNFVKGANVFGNAKGTAVGVAPLAHLAIYKICSTACSESDLLAAMDTAIDDGVDILSLSLGGISQPFHSDNIAMGAFSAMEKGIFVSCAAGNNGPDRSTLANEAPWILTVGASTMDRTIRATAILGNNEEMHGESLYQPKDFPAKQYPLVFPGINTNDANLEYCPPEMMNSTQLRGKIVICLDGDGITRQSKGKNVKAAGGVGMIIINEEFYGYTTSADAHVLPAAHLSYVDGLKVVSYIFNASNSSTASISFKGTIIGHEKHAPFVAGFSSRGPNQASPGILKPDIVGPGVNILAAWHLSVEDNTNTKSNFNVISGTSMACPHLSGIAALLKSVYPNWSPAAIKSAIMTTADVVNLAGHNIEDESLLPASPLATGSGHVNIAKASNPGLVYDLKRNDYIPYLCGLNYTTQQIRKIVQRKITCRTSIPEAQLNYPSFSITFGSTIQTYSRTVTNVGTANSSYSVQVVPPPGVDVKVQPKTLKFSQLNQKLTYTVTFRRLRNTTTTGENSASHGYLRWISAKYSVRSPIVASMGETVGLE